MNRGGKRKTSKKTYKKKKSKKYNKYNKKSSYSSSSNAKFIKKVINKTLHPELKRYNCLRLTTDTTKNINWAINGITVKSTDINTVNTVSDNNGYRSPWQWYQLNVKPNLASSDTFYSLEGSKMNLKYIYLKGSITFKRLNANNASALELQTRVGNLRLRIACCRGESLNPNILNKYNDLYDNVETLASNSKNGIDLSDDLSAWSAYHVMTRRQYAYKNLKIWTVKKWKWNRWNKAQSAQGAIAEGSGTIVSHADPGGANLIIPFNCLIRINKNIIYRQTTNNVNDGYDECNLKYFYCFEGDCGVEHLEYQVDIGGVGVYTDC